jgi:hypothetical protein
MRQRRRVVSPRIVLPYAAELWLFAALLVLALAAAAFYGGALLGEEEAKSLRRTIVALREERDGLSEALASANQEKISLERNLQINEEASRTAQETLKEAQDERMLYEREATLLKRLIRQGGGGVLKVQDFAVTPLEEEGLFGYAFTVTQMIQDFGESKGRLSIKLAGRRDGKEVVLPLDALPGSDPTAQRIGFKHFQNIEGKLKVPEDVDPEALMVEVKPTSQNLIPVIETFPWPVTSDQEPQ